MIGRSSQAEVVATATVVVTLLAELHACLDEDGRQPAGRSPFPRGKPSCGPTIRRWSLGRDLHDRTDVLRLRPVLLVVDGPVHARGVDGESRGPRLSVSKPRVRTGSSGLLQDAS